MWETKKALKKELYASEDRASSQYVARMKAETKLRRIATVIESAEQSKELYAFTIEKIKKILVNNDQITN